jgi:hypothetical protein
MEYIVTTQPVTKNLFIIEYQLTDLSFVKNFKELIDKNVGPLNYKTNVKGKMTSWDFFKNVPEFNNILFNIGQIFTTFPFVEMTLTQAWGNIIEKKDEVIMHNHRYDCVSGILYLTENGPGTYFPQFNKTVVEKIGKFIFFSSEANHSVAPSIIKQKRYTIACNFNEIARFNNE